MDQSTIEFTQDIWPNSTNAYDHAPVHSTAEIILPKGHMQFEGTFIASGVRRNNVSYMILEAERSDQFTKEQYLEGTSAYRAFRTDVKIDPAQWQSWDRRPTLMCRAVVLEGYGVTPFRGWEVHQPTPGEGWYLISGQNIEQRTAPASQWAEEIQCTLLPQLEARVKHLPQVLERCERISLARRYLSPEDLEEPCEHPQEWNPANITHYDLVRDNLVGHIEGYWRDEQPNTYLTAGITDLHMEIPCLQRRAVQAERLLEALHSLENRPIEMKRTMVRAERRFSLPIPVRPLFVTVQDTVRSEDRMRMRRLGFSAQQVRTQLSIRPHTAPGKKLRI